MKVNKLLGTIFNTHMLTEESLNRYSIERDKMERWLKENRVSYFSVSVLPSEYYADASHALKEGYVKMTEELFEDESFREWMEASAPSVRASPSRFPLPSRERIKVRG